MPRVKRGVTARAKHKKVFAQAKGFRGRRGNVFRIAKEAVMKAEQYAYRDRRQRKRQFRALFDLFRVHERPEEGRGRSGPQGARRSGGGGQGGVRKNRRTGEGQARHVIL